MRTSVFSASILVLVLLALPDSAAAAIYLYEGPNKEKLITDRLVKKPGYRLITRNQTVKYMGHLAAERSIASVNGTPERYRVYIETSAAKNNLSPLLITAIMQVESNFNPMARSHAGAIGLMQLMPGTASRFDVEDIYNPRQNIEGAARYLRVLKSQFGDNLHLVLAAYNAGENNVRKYRGIPPFDETRRYVRKVLGVYESLRQNSI